MLIYEDHDTREEHLGVVHALAFSADGSAIASGGKDGAVFLRDEKFEKPIRGQSGEIAIDPKSIRTFDPLDVGAMRRVWRGFRGFGHAKQALNPTLYSKFTRGLKNVKTP